MFMLKTHFTLTTALPMFSPLNNPMNASAADSKPTEMCS